MNIPIYKVSINDIDEGINRISLVEYPAVESNFLAFADNKKQVMFSANEEQQMITGVLMRCDFPIYRIDNAGEYYIEFDAQVIKEMAEKLLVDAHQNWVNIEHQAGSDVNGVYMVELFIKNTEKGINPKGFEDITDGSLFATFKVRNERIWNDIRKGTFRGFSIEGTFQLTESNDIYDDILHTLNKIIDKIK